MRALIDLNVVLDVLMKREPHFDNSAAVWKLVEGRQVEGLVAAHSLSTLHYLYTNQTSREHAVLALHQLLRVFKVATVDQDVIETALSYNWIDFEDAMQMAAAERAGCSYLVTRNPSDFKPGVVMVIQPADFLAIAGTFTKIS
jgi:predicted nucleic acid-binding protein